MSRSEVPPYESEDFIRGRRHEARGAKPRIARLDNLACRPNEDVGIPYRRHAVIRHGLDADRDVAGSKVDRCDAMGFRKRKERVGHEVLCVSWREIAGKRPEKRELPALRDCLVSCRHRERRILSAHFVRHVPAASAKWRLAGRTEPRGSDVEVTAPRSAHA